MGRVNSDEWTKIWRIDFENYLKRPPRLGIFLWNYFGNEIKNALEVGCGSARDSLYLAKKDVDVVAVDYNEFVIKLLEKRFSDVKNLSFRVGNALNISKNIDGKFDLTFHNGLIIYLDPNEITTILKEQYMITRKYMVIVAHNKQNKHLIDRFDRKSGSSKLYDIHFFTPDEIIHLAEGALGDKIKSIKILKFGHRFLDVLYYFYKINDRINWIGKLISKLYFYVSWRYIERIVVVVELQNQK